MSRLLVLGAAPLPFEPMERQYAANLRTWHFVKPLLDDGHEVRLLAFRLPNTYPPDTPPETWHRDGKLEYVSMEGHRFEDIACLGCLRDEFQPEAVIGVNSHPSSRAAIVAAELPLWCDMNGWLMAEAQTKAHVYGDDRYLSHFWKIEQTVLDRADMISTVSEAQAHATVGELAARGRLNTATFGYDFVVRIPNAACEVPLEPTATVFRGRTVPEDAFVVLWLGGYNTWTDVDLLFSALDRAMAQCPDLYFVSTGGVIEGHDERTFVRFQEQTRNSEHRQRYLFQGWVPTAEVPSYYAESDLGINVDSWNYETVFGARNRINEMARADLPVLTTLGTEISQMMAARNLALATEVGDAEAFAERLVWAAGHRQELRGMADKAAEWIREEFSYARTTEPLRRWAQEPRRAPDYGRRVEYGDIDFFRQSPDPAAQEHAAQEHAAEPSDESEPSATAVASRWRDRLPDRLRQPLARMKRYLLDS